MLLEDRYAQVQDRIARATQRANRNLADVRLVAVSKGRSLAEILQLYELGQRDFGENRIEEASEKIKLAPPDITWHMIGHVQSRKAKEVAQQFKWVHSVETVALGTKLNSAVAASPLLTLIECNVSGEESKFGLAAAAFDQSERWLALRSDFEKFLALPNLRVCGLMTMAPIVPTPEAARPVFRRLRNLRDKLVAEFNVGLPELSMGMTDDFEIAIEEGATLVRVGRAIFAPQN